MEVVAPEHYNEAVEISSRTSLSLGEALDQVVAREKRLQATRDVLDGNSPLSFEILVRLAAGFAPATEAQVWQEVKIYLLSRGATTLSDYTDSSSVPSGTLVYLQTQQRRPTGCSVGIPDLWIARVDWWGWLGEELKGRGKNGKCGTKISPAQKVAIASRLYAIAWCPAHVGLDVERLDRESGYSERGSNGKTKRAVQAVAGKARREEEGARLRPGSGGEPANARAIGANAEGRGESGSRPSGSRRGGNGDGGSSSGGRLLRRGSQR